MGMVTDVLWVCPGCETSNIALLYDEHYFPKYCDNPQPIPRKAIPSNAILKWNPPCKKCGQYKLVEPPVILVEFPIQRVYENK